MENRAIKSIYNHWLPVLLGAGGVTIGHTIYYAKPKEQVPTWMIRHEMAHIEQYRRYGTVLFLILYFYEYLQNRKKGMNHNDAYMNISFEIEARKAERMG